MKFQCLSCQKRFVYPAKKMEPLGSDDKALAFKTGELIIVNSQLETHVCPYCQSLDFDEAPPEQAPRMTDMVECEVSAVPAYLGKGYVVLDRYATKIRLAKYEEESKYACFGTATSQDTCLMCPDNSECVKETVRKSKEAKKEEKKQ